MTLMADSPDEVGARRSGATAGLSSSARPLEDTAGRASSGTQKESNLVYQRPSLLLRQILMRAQNRVITHHHLLERLQAETNFLVRVGIRRIVLGVVKVARAEQRGP